MPQRKTSSREHAPAAVIVVLNLPVPDDHRVWAQAQALRDAGIRVTVVCPSLRGAEPGRRAIDGIDIVCFRSFEGTGKLGTAIEGAWTTFIAARGAKQALRASARSGSSALQVCNPPDLSFRLLRWARRRGIRTIYDQHDVVPLLAAARPAFRRLEPFFRACERRTVESADTVLTPSQEQAERIQKLYGRTALVVRTAAVHGADDEQPAKDVTVLGYLGVIGEQDGVVDLIAAVHELRARGRRDFRVEIAGDGPALESVRDRVTELGLEDTVKLLGWVGKEEIDSFLKGIDAMLVPDPDIEFNHYCAMNKVTHAMARAIPVVLRPLRENTRIVGEAGILARDMTLPAFTDAIERLLDTPAPQRADLGTRLQAEFDAALSWSTHGPRYLSAFPSA